MYFNKEKTNNPFLQNNNCHNNRQNRQRNSLSLEKKENKKEKIDLSIEQFPVLDTKNTQENIKTDYLDYTKIQTNTQEKNISNKNTIRPGWQVIYRKNNKIVTENGPPIIKKTSKIVPKTLTEETMKTYKILSNHWNNYRDKENDLLGEQSNYWNYKNDINEIYKEELSILNEMDECYILSNSDDEEDNLYNEITDNYDFY